MAKLYFYYSSMNAGKSTSLLQSSYNYKERGMNTLVLAPRLDDRFGRGKVASRIGIESDARSKATQTCSMSSHRKMSKSRCIASSLTRHSS
jgi:thymidine kinase